MAALPQILLDEPGFVVANKPSGMLSEGGGEREVDLERAVSKIVGRQVWCCHRLDRLTSGIVVLRKGKLFLKQLASQFESRAVRKEYWLLVEGIWDRRIQKVESQIAPSGRGVYANVESGGKPAASTFQVLGVDEASGVSWLRGLLKTGRTHQLRLHALKSGCPVLGDPLYGDARADGLFGLHARSLRMRHPASGAALEFEAEAPEAWRSWIEKMQGLQG
ncbi:RluA family pseudouridine synthase [Pelagicoccus sp. NFK12]|uniref:RluA family pseudouridine synthase n=1 Tax=Pelagicoccus enzymogenes TaxID=2773457 RepID=A0A927F813_9BACT|nr:RluA family pseudouridine synthase [Pelagicoccus enzymogenes]MBD5780158.1 RluA family pseudouridine synthase [Pelagicoccus enzymogenes]